MAGQDNGTPIGFTCQSFAALSLDPVYVLFCPSLSSQSWPRMRSSATVCINILASDQIHLATRFAARAADRFDGLGWKPAANGAPALPDVLARIEADIVSESVAGDHSIVVAAPTKFWVGTDRAPLLYHRGKLGAAHDMHR